MDDLSSVPSAGSLCIHIFRAESSVLLIHVIFVLHVLNPLLFLSSLQVFVLCRYAKICTFGGFYGGIFLTKISALLQSLDGNVVVRSDARVSSLTLKYAKYTDAGQYLCTARSAIGEDEQPAHLEVRCEYRPLLRRLPPPRLSVVAHTKPFFFFLNKMLQKSTARWRFTPGSGTL